MWHSRVTYFDIIDSEKSQSIVADSRLYLLINR